MRRYIAGIAAFTAALSLAGPAEARRGGIWIPTSDTGLEAMIAIVVILLIIVGAFKLLRKGAKVVAEQSTSISRETGALAREAVEAHENTPSAWADKLGAKLEHRAAERVQAAASPTASRAAGPASRPVRTASLSGGQRSTFGKR